MDYEMISEEEFKNYESEYYHDKYSVPMKRFVARTADGEYLAMDNSDGNCFVEQCSSKVLVEEFFNDGLGYDDDYSNLQAIPHKNYNW